MSRDATVTTPLATGLLSEEQAAEYLGLSARYLQERRYRGGGPTYIRISHRTVRYDPRALAAWLTERSFTATCQEPVEAVDGLSGDSR